MGLLPGPPLPKEHGAYGQLAIPLVTALVVTKGSPGGALFAVAAVAGFLMHEPLVVGLGHRGTRARTVAGSTARTWTFLWGVVLLLAGGGGVLLLGDRWWIAALPVVPAGILFDAAVRGAEKSALAQVAAALGFAATAAPVVAAGHAPIQWIWIVPAVLGASGVLSTLAVRAVIAHARASADPSGVVPARAAVLIAVLATLIPGAVAVRHGAVSLWVFGAVCPAALAACTLALRPPRPQRLRMVGWTLAAGSVLTAVLLVAGLLRG